MTHTHIDRRGTAAQPLIDVLRADGYDPQPSDLACRAENYIVGDGSYAFGVRDARLGYATTRDGRLVPRNAETRAAIEAAELVRQADMVLGIAALESAGYGDHAISVYLRGGMISTGMLRAINS